MDQKEYQRLYQKAYREKNREKLNKAQKAWREANKERIKEYSARYYEANKDNIAAYHREWQQKNVKPSENSDASEDTGITHSTKFLIGDRVKIPSKSGKIGNVADIWTSLYQNAVMYAVDDESGNRGLYAENQLEAAPVPITYRFTATIDGNVAVVCMYAAEGDKETVISRGHAHIIHDGPTGLAQAASYAAKRMFESLDRQNENRIYCKEDY